MRKTIWIMMLVLLGAVLNGEELRLALYKNGYCSGNPAMFIRKDSRSVTIYSNGYGSGNPEVSVRGAASVKDVTELFVFYYVTGMW